MSGTRKAAQTAQHNAALDSVNQLSRSLLAMLRMDYIHRRAYLTPKIFLRRLRINSIIRGKQAPCQGRMAIARSPEREEIRTTLWKSVGLESPFSENSPGCYLTLISIRYPECVKMQEGRQAPMQAESAMTIEKTQSSGWHEERFTPRSPTWRGVLSRHRLP